MPAMPLPGRYDSTAILLHWLMAVLIIALWVLGVVMVDLPKGGPLRGNAFGLHKAVGCVVLALVAVRLAWRLARRPPPLPTSMPPMERLGAHAGHAALYVLMVVLPVSGILTSQTGGRDVSVFGLILPRLIGTDKELHDLFEGIHEVGAWMLAAVVVIHVAAAVRHHLVLKDDVLTRMLPHR